MNVWLYALISYNYELVVKGSVAKRLQRPTVNREIVSSNLTRADFFFFVVLSCTSQLVGGRFCNVNLIYFMSERTL